MFGFNLATVTLAILGAAASNASPLERRACPTYEIIVARGTGDPQGSSNGFTGMLTQALAALPGSARYDVNYPASFDFYNSIQAGVSDLRTHLFNGVTFCPNQKYALIGYSQGAEVMNNYLQNVNSTSNSNIYSRIKAVVYIGNPSKSAYNPSNFDENGGKLTDPYSGGGIAGFKTPPLTAWINSGKLHDICHTYDVVCAFNQPNPDPSNNNGHFEYQNSTSVQNQGANFIISKITS
ncbi:hypothetical protein OC846_001155 [Tilletia horrida]|uniref:Cutinase n=1 Tax=Tilletia horrida TaxID=155126 RepID=A0AAN6GWV8_9BASI|nr:hypothetical protein OC845_003856 [Tilletia horrida]KAK0556458.1 hypothetical protein OC846_001155 [Tilletia horrida]KAK0569388.1 hypothetical protein OC861_000994 [Tilletia horrida]